MTFRAPGILAIPWFRVPVFHLVAAQGHVVRDLHLERGEGVVFVVAGPLDVLQRKCVVRHGKVIGQIQDVGVLVDGIGGVTLPLRRNRAGGRCGCAYYGWWSWRLSGPAERVLVVGRWNGVGRRERRQIGRRRHHSSGERGACTRQNGRLQRNGRRPDGRIEVVGWFVEQRRQ